MRTIRTPKTTARFTVGELEDYPIVIVTHEFFKNVRGEKARLHRRSAMAFPRVVTFVDEKIEQVKVYEVKFLDIVQVLEHIEGTDDSPASLKSEIGQLRRQRERIRDPQTGDAERRPGGRSASRELVW